MGKINIGSLSVDKAYIGTDEVQKMYFGETEVYSKAPVGYSVSIEDWKLYPAEQGDSEFYYSVDNGSTWIPISYEYRGVLVSTITQIRFKVVKWSGSRAIGGIDSYPPGTTYLSFGIDDTTVTGDNVVLTGDINLTITDRIP